MHIFNMWTIIMQSLNEKEWKLLELQITQTRHPKSVADRQTDGPTDRRSGPTTRPAFAKGTQVTRNDYTLPIIKSPKPAPNARDSEI